MTKLFYIYFGGTIKIDSKNQFIGLINYISKVKFLSQTNLFS